MEEKPTRKKTRQPNISIVVSEKTTFLMYRQIILLNFEILACILDNYLLLTTSHTQILQRYPPSPPQGGGGFDHFLKLFSAVS